MPRKTKLPPKNLYIRHIHDGKKISVGEYIRAKWNNVIDPFAPDDTEAVQRLKEMIELFKKREGRDVELIGYGASQDAVTTLRQLLG